MLEKIKGNSISNLGTSGNDLCSLTPARYKCQETVCLHTSQLTYKWMATGWVGLSGYRANYSLLD